METYYVIRWLNDGAVVTSRKFATKHEARNYVGFINYIRGDEARKHDLYITEENDDE